jgi:hypothetical protein
MEDMAVLKTVARVRIYSVLALTFVNIEIHLNIFAAQFARHLSDLFPNNSFRC